MLIFHEDGFIDKFIGDAIMAIFAQADLREQAFAAVSAAVKMQRDLDFMHTCGFRVRGLSHPLSIHL